MRVIKRINNNVAICVDDNQNELIAFGKGISFPKMPYEITDLSVIERTFYDVSPQQMLLLNEIPAEIIALTIEIINKASRVLKISFRDSLVFALADHINFAIERTKKGLVLPNPMGFEIPHLYPEETQLGRWAVGLIYRRLYIRVPDVEASNIAMHFINAKEMTLKQEEEERIQFQAVSDITDLLENEFSCIFDQTEFNYARFVSHLIYLLKRQSAESIRHSENIQMLNSMKNRFPKSFQAALKIQHYLRTLLGIQIHEEELLYLMIHINRLISREEECRKG